MTSGYYEIINWEKYQHYKKRRPPWFKVYQDLFSSDAWVEGDDASRVLMIASMMLASRTQNRIPAKSSYIQKVACLNSEPDFTHLLDADFIRFVDDASETLASCKQNAIPETETETETEREKEDSSILPQKSDIEKPLAQPEQPGALPAPDAGAGTTPAAAPGNGFPPANNQDAAGFPSNGRGTDHPPEEPAPPVSPSSASSGSCDSARAPGAAPLSKKKLIEVIDETPGDNPPPEPDPKSPSKSVPAVPGGGRDPEDALFLLKKYHADQMGYEVDNTPLRGPVESVMRELLHDYGETNCRQAVRGHVKEANREGSQRGRSLAHCFQGEKDSPYRADRVKFWALVQAGDPEPTEEEIRERQRKEEEARQLQEEQDRASEQLAKEAGAQRLHGPARARAIQRYLMKRERQ